MADTGDATIAVAPSGEASAGGPHPGQLSRVLHVPGTIAIVVSASRRLRRCSSSPGRVCDGRHGDVLGVRDRGCDRRRGRVLLQ